MRHSPCICYISWFVFAYEASGRIMTLTWIQSLAEKEGGPLSHLPFSEWLIQSPQGAQTYRRGANARTRQELIYRFLTRQRRFPSWAKETILRWSNCENHNSLYDGNSCETEQSSTTAFGCWQFNDSGSCMVGHTRLRQWFTGQT